MRKKIDISTFAMICIALGLYGIVLLCKSFLGGQVGPSALDLKAISAQTIKNRQSVKGYIMDCVKKPVGDKGKVIGESAHVSKGLADYAVYTIPVSEGEYIRFYASADATKKGLETIVEGGSATIAVKGQISEESNLDTLWYEDISNFDKEKLISTYVIKEISPMESKALIAIGIVLILVSIFGIKSGVSSRYESNLVDNTDHNNMENMERELQYIREQLDKMYAKEHSLILETLLGLFFMVAGAAYSIFSPYLPVIGWLFIAAGIKKIWSGFINSDHGAAISIADKLNISTLQTRKNMHEQFAHELDHTIQKEKHKKEELMRLR